MRSLRLASLESDIASRLRELRRLPAAVYRSRARVEKALQSGEVIYGVTTGFGALKSEKISAEDAAKLQVNLLRSHAAGTGSLIPREITALMLALKVHALALGASGISPHVIQFLRECAVRQVIPRVPSRGSVGASGDLAPLAHLGLLTIGEGHCWDRKDGTVAAVKALRRASLRPITLGAKDGLAIVNGTQMMTAYGAYVLAHARNLLLTADIAGALSLSAVRGSGIPFRSEFYRARPHPGHGTVARNISKLVKGSSLVSRKGAFDRVQDPYSLRCIPQVHGAVRDALAHVEEVVEREMNSSTDNPLVFSSGSVLSGGNFHGEPLALSLDYAAIALAELASISERRIYLLLDGYDGLPPFLVRGAGLNSGFMVAQYTAAALVSENKVLAHPASVDSIPTCRGQEDHVSMGSVSAHKLYDIFCNVQRVLGIELLLAAQAIDLRRPERAGSVLEGVVRIVRKSVPFVNKDRHLGTLIERSTELVRSGEIAQCAHRLVRGLA